MKPDNNPQISNPETPNSFTIGIRITIKAAVGPEIFTLLLPKIAANVPAIIAVYSPSSGGTPVAIANAIDNGRAIIPTVKPDRTLFFILLS